MIYITLWIHYVYPCIHISFSFYKHQYCVTFLNLWNKAISSFLSFFFPEKELIDLFLMKCMRIGFEILDISTFCILRIFCRARMLNCNIKSEDHTSVDSCRNSRNISFTKSYKQSIDIFTDCFEKNRVHHRKCVT